MYVNSVTNLLQNMAALIDICGSTVGRNILPVNNVNNLLLYDTVSDKVYKFVPKGSKLKVFVIGIKFDENDFLLIIM